MPSVAKAHDAPATTLAPSHNTDRSAQDPLKSVKAIVDRMHSLTSDDPYVLTIPQDQSHYFQHYGYQKVQWLDHSPFSAQEREDLQYQTFHFREQGKDMFMLENSWTLTNHQPGKDVKEQKPKTLGNGSGTPNVKKISLNAYKKKLAGATPIGSELHKHDALSKQPAVKGPVERLKAESDKVLADVAKSDGEESIAATSPKKRKREEDVDINDKGIHSYKSTARRSPERSLQNKGDDGDEPSSASNKKSSKQALSAVPDDLSGLPPRLLPPRLSPLQHDAMPPRLSPTMPENIEASLLALVQRKAKTSLTEPQKALKVKSSPSRLTNGHSPPGRSRTPPITSESVIKNKSVSKGVSRGANVGEEIAVSRTKRKTETSPSSLVVKLKFKENPDRTHPTETNTPLATGKKESNAAKTTESAAAKSSVASKSTTRDISGKGVAQKIGPVSSSLPKKSEEKKPKVEKRALAPDDTKFSEPPNKRSKVADGLRTPVQAHISSPSVASGVGKLSQQVTPTLRKDHLSTAMKRELSTDTISNTPSARPTDTPNYSDRSNVPMPRSSQPAPPATRTSEQAAWEAMQKEFDMLGRELKHAAADQFKSAGKETKDRPSSAPSSYDQRLAAVKSLESVLSYVFAFTCADQAALAAEPKLNPPMKLWQSLTRFYISVKRNCEDIPLLSGIACFLGVTFNARILQIISQRPIDLPSREILEMYTALQREVTDAESSLDVDTLMNAFPKTWAGRTKRGSISSLVSLNVPGHLAGPYKLPIGLQSPPILAARACFMMLQEWLDKPNTLEYRMKLKLANMSLEERGS